MQSISYTIFFVFLSISCDIILITFSITVREQFPIKWHKGLGLLPQLWIHLTSCNSFLTGWGSSVVSSVKHAAWLKLHFLCLGLHSLSFLIQPQLTV